MATTYTKITSGTPSATSAFNDFGTIASIGDDNAATGWSSGNTFAATLNDFVGYSYPADVEVRKIETYFHTWGKTIVVGMAPTWNGTDRSKFVVLRTIDVTQTPNDDLGVPWARFTTNTILIPAGVAVGRGLAIWTLDTAVNLLGNGSSGVDRLRVMEMTAYTGAEDTPPPPTYKKILNGAVFASSTFSSSSAISVTDDGALSTSVWEGNAANAASYTDFLGRLFTMPIKVKQIKIQFYRWSRYIRIGYASGQPSNKNGFTLIREIDTKTQTADDAGVPWSTWAQRPNGAFHTINIPDYPASLAIGIYQGDTSEGGPISDNVPTGSNSRMGVYEAQYFNDGDTLPNPKPPATVPVLPFTATPANWVRTEFKTPGTFNFTPAADTTLVLAVAVGGGAGGRINYNRVGSTQTPNTGVGGGHAVVANSKGVLLRARGGQDFNVPPEIDVAQSNFEMDWLRYVDSGASAGAPRAVGNTAAPAGGRGTLGTAVAGTTFTFQTQDLNNGFGTTNRLDTTNMPTLPVQPVLDGFVRDANGFTSTLATGQSGSASLTLNGVAGQTFTIVFGRTGAYGGPIQIYVNDVLITTDASTWGGSKSTTYTATEDGPVKLEIRHTSSNGASPVRFERFSISTVGYGPSQSGASGRLGQVYLLPEPLTLTVPAGGKGIKGDHSYLTTAQNGTLGGGGAAGGDGGDGVIYIYEYKGGLLNDQQPNVLFANYNSLTLDTGVYRTQYTSNVGDKTGKKDYVHYLRPKTKSVIVLMTGQGGRSSIGSGVQASEQWLPTTLNYGAKSFTAQAGWTGRYIGGSTGYGGVGGDFVTTEETVLSATGTAGGSTAGSTTNPSVIAGGFGTGGNSSYLFAGGGGCGGYGLFVLDALSDDRTIEISLGDSYSAAYAGAVFIYETELPIPVTVTQVAELVLQKDPIGPTQVTQSAQLVLQKDPAAPTRLTQTVMMVLLREPKATTVAVTETYIDVVTPAERGNTRVSQSVQSVLIESDPIDQNVTQVAALVLVREIPTLLEKMDFGVMRYPEKHMLYTSDIKTVSGIGAGNELRLQFEGDLPEGSTIIVNGVDIEALTFMAKDGDTVQLKSGITNFFVSRYTVYAYVSRQDQIIREIAGWWSILQADLSPRKRAIISVAARYSGMLASYEGIAKTGVQYIAPKNREATNGKLVAKAARSQDGAKAQLVPKVAKQNTAILELLRTAVRSAAHPVTQALPAPVKMEPRVAMFDMWHAVYAPFENVLSKKSTFVRSLLKDANSKPLGWMNRGSSWAKGVNIAFRPLPPGSVSAGGSFLFMSLPAPGGEGTDMSFRRNNGSAPSHADMQFDKYHAAATTYKYLEFVSGFPQASTFVAQAYVYTPHYVFSSIESTEYIIQERDKVAFIGHKYDWWIQHDLPTKDQEFERGKTSDARPKPLEFVATVPQNILLHGGFGWNSVHPNGRANVVREFARSSTYQFTGTTQSFDRVPYTALLGPKQSYSTVKPKSTLIPVSYRISKAKATLFGMKPMLYQAGKNKISAAKYYMGFTTKAEVDAFIVNFLKPTTKTKLDGWVYRVGVDETLVCEVRGPNMPIAWLMHGG